MKKTNEIKNTLDGINDRSDIKEETISKLEGTAKDYQKWNTRRKKIHKNEKGGISELQGNFKRHNMCVIWGPKGMLGQKTYLKK